MGGFFGVASKCDCMMDVFFGVDYHSHLGTRRGGMAAWDPKIGLQRKIHSIENSPFRTKFENIFDEMQGTSVIGCISDSDPQPMLIRSHLGTYAITTVGIINNADELIQLVMNSQGGYFDAMTGGRVNTTELVAALINRKKDFVEGIQYAQSIIDGTSNILILTDRGSLIAARDKLGRIPVQIGKDENGYCASFEEFAFTKLGYEKVCELGPGEIVELTPESMIQLAAPGDKMKVCAFLWSYYGYPTSTYEGINVEAMRYRNGAAIAERDLEQGRSMDLDYVGGVPDSGTPHAIGYANRTGKSFARAFIKYTPTWSRSFTPAKQSDRKKVAKMKQIPVHELIKGKNLLFVDDSIVRGTQLQETVEFLYENGAKSVHMRSACPPIMYGCKYLNFSRSTSDMDLISRRVIMELEGEEGFRYLAEYADGNTERGKKMRQTICEKFKFASLGFQTVDGVVKAIGLDPCKLCTYCWNGKE
ncbi:MAG: amidophosphoribosyltransferase [Oscillospiraceae bacterium]|nr:amidophosphoribosyltransferase [Oscillospiraceae bacterium]